jgi:hypothetical protein
METLIMGKQNVTIDFDGVLYSYTSGWQGADVLPDLPNPGAREFLEQAVKKFRVQILSTRSHQPGGIEAMYQWCGLHFGAYIADELVFVTHKEKAIVYIDDRAIQFNGTWPTIEQIKDFKPWYKRNNTPTDSVKESAFLLLTEFFEWCEEEGAVVTKDSINELSEEFIEQLRVKGKEV